MEIIRVNDYDEMSQKAADIMIDRIRNSKELTLGLATGGTPKGTYKRLIEDHQKNKTSYQHVSTFNLDEYAGLSPSDPHSYRYYMSENLFNYIDVADENIHIPNGTANDLKQECQRYDSLINEYNGIDLQILGIGKNGHIGFNEPQTPFTTNTHVVELTPSTRQANARYFNSLNDVPTHAVTMGIASILKSKQILLLVSGEEKAKAMQELQSGEISEDFPASALKKHRNVTVIADKKALPTLLVHP